MDFLVPFTAITLAMAFMAVRRRRASSELFGRIAYDRGWDFTDKWIGIEAPGPKRSRPWPRVIQGTYEDRAVTICTRMKNLNKNSVRMTIELSTDVEIRPQVLGEFGAMVHEMFSDVEPIKLGFPYFDGAISLRGDAAVLLARLDSEGRSLLQRFIEWGGWIEGNFLCLEYTDKGSTFTALSTTIDLILKVASMIDSVDGNDQELLYESVCNGESSENRLLCFQALTDPRLRHEAAKQLADDANHENRVEGLIALKDCDAILAFLAEPEPRKLSLNAQLVDALIQMNNTAGYRTLRAIVEQQIGGVFDVVNKCRNLPLELPLKCLTALVEAGDLRVLPLLPDYLIEYGSKARAPLLQILENDDDDIAISAIRGLARFGEMTLVKEIANRAKKGNSSEIEKAAANALDEIQKSSGVDMRGAIALAAQPGGGELSVSNDVQKGRVTLARKENLQGKSSK
jgi:hypothetical protein